MELRECSGTGSNCTENNACFAVWNASKNPYSKSDNNSSIQAEVDWKGEVISSDQVIIGFQLRLLIPYIL